MTAVIYIEFQKFNKTDVNFLKIEKKEFRSNS